MSTTALALAPSLPLALVAALAVGFTNVEIISGTNALVQLRAAPAMRGRVLALLSVVFLGSTPIGSPIVGWIGQEIGPRAAIAIGGVATALVVAWVARLARRTADDEATDAHLAPVEHLDPEPALRAVAA